MMKRVLSCALVLFSIAQANLQADFLNTQDRSIAADCGHLMLTKPFAVFKSYKGAKYPYVLRYNPAQNEFTSTMCGTLDAEGNIGLVKEAEHLENLVVVRKTMKSLDGGFQVDQIFDGYRESYIGCFLEAVMITSGLLPREPYVGTIIIDEMLDGVDMKWVLQNIGEFKSLRAFLERNIAEKGLTFKTKPHLLIDIIKNDAELDAEDLAFLDTYFTVVDPSDTATMDFYHKAAGAMTRITAGGVDFAYAGECFGSKLLRLLEKDCSKFKIGEWAADGAKIAVIALTTAVLLKIFNDYVATPAQRGASDAVGAAGNSIRARVSGSTQPA